MIDAADAVVVGSGAFGSSIAYHLARHGLRVALLDRSRLASQTSPRAAGLTSQVRATPALTAIARRAVVKLATFTDETGQPLRFTQSGALKIARNERDAAQLGREVERGRDAGIPIDFVSTAEARRRLPILRERGIAAVTWSPTDCNVEPAELPIGYCRAAEKIGATLLPHTPAIGFEIGPRGVEGVRTPQGTIATRVVVDAAGAWSRLVAERLGGTLPVVPTRHQLFITEAIPGVSPDFPIARVIDAHVYVRHERGGLMLGRLRVRSAAGRCRRAVAGVRDGRAATGHRRAPASRGERRRSVPDLPGFGDPDRRAPRRPADAHHRRPLPGGAAAGRRRGLGDEWLLRRWAQRVAGVGRSAGRVDRQRDFRARPVGDLDGSLRGAQSRRG